MRYLHCESLFTRRFQNASEVGIFIFYCWEVFACLRKSLNVSATSFVSSTSNAQVMVSEGRIRDT